MSKISLAFLKSLSAVTSNLSAAWFALALVTPNFTNISNTEIIVVLTRDVVFGILWLVLTVIIERTLA